MNFLTIQGHCAILSTSNRGLSSASCVRSICSSQQRPMRFAPSWSQCSPSICASVPVLEKWLTIHGWMWIGTRKRGLLRALRGERIDVSQGHNSAGTAAMQLHRAFRPLGFFPLPYSDVRHCLRVTTPFPLFFPAYYFIGWQLIVLLINITIRDALLWNLYSHSSTLHPMSCMLIVDHMCASITLAYSLRNDATGWCP